MITNKCPEKYMTTLKHPITKFCQCEPLTLFSRPNTEYGTITSSNPIAKLQSHECTLESNHTNCWPLSTAQWWKIIHGRRQWNNQQQSTSLPLLQLCTCICTFQQKLKAWREKPDIDNIYANFVIFMTQQEEDLLNNQPISGTTGFSKAMVDSIVHKKIQEFINQMVPFYQSSFEQESVNDINCSHNISTTKMLTQSLCKTLKNPPEKTSR